MIIEEENYLAHYGILRRSGRYPWGSGGNAPRHRSFLDWLKSLRESGMTESEIAKSVGISTTELRALNTIARNEQKQDQINQAQRLKDKGYSNVAGAARMGVPESTFRALLEPGAKERADILGTTTQMLKSEVDSKGLLDVSKGVENHIGISKEKLATAVAMLKEEGYGVHYVKIPQVGTGLDTTTKVLAPPGMTSKEVYALRGDIRTIGEMSDDGGRTWYGIKPPKAIDPSRVEVKWKEDGGDLEDGVMYVRPGVEDVSLGGSRYAQVRVKVGDGHYLKGMAVYKDDLPDGVDILFNTNKTRSENKLDALKELSTDPDNPFGAQIKRQILNDDKTETKSVMNIVNEEGDWNTWANTISSQVLSKQSPSLAKEQLAMSFERRQNEFNEIMAMTNPTVRKKLLEEFADGADSAAVHLRAAALPRQRYQVIIPVNALKPTEIYAPNFRNGEKVALIRYPHGGTFEIPELTVNNRQPLAKKLLGQAQDAVGINSKVAEQLSGADFDGDTVLVIPNNLGRIKKSPPLEALKGFDPRAQYKLAEGAPRIKPQRMQQEMGDVSNLITDMTIHGASHAEIARAVKHSMVVIDSHKHGLDVKRSAADNGIRQLKAKYQGSSRAGASTLVSRAESPVRVDERKPRPAAEGGPIDRATGKKVYVPTNKTYVNKAGETVKRTTKSTKLAETDDAFTLSSGTPIEKVYAEHSNRLKAMGNQARLAMINTPRATYSPTAARTYSNEVASLNAKLNVALRNAPLERRAQTVANTVIRAKIDADPTLTPEQRKKIASQALNEARARTGAKKNRVQFTPREWEAIQAGAISDSKLSEILNNADMDQVRSLATPRTQKLMTPAKTQRARSMLALGYTRAEIADQLGVSLSTLDLATVADS